MTAPSRRSVHKKSQRDLVTPWGRTVDAYIFGRSYQEVEKQRYNSVATTLEANDPEWRKRDLIVMPSHVGSSDIDDIKEMIEVAHRAGFDTVAAPIIHWDEDSDNRESLAPALALNWSARWTIPNEWCENPEGQLWALGNDLWSWISRALTQ